MEQIDLERIERNVFRSYFEDGLVDIVFGAYFSILGLLLPAGGAIAPFIVLIIILLIRPYGLFGKKEIERL